MLSILIRRNRVELPAPHRQMKDGKWAGEGKKKRGNKDQEAFRARRTLQGIGPDRVSSWLHRGPPAREEKPARVSKRACFVPSEERGREPGGRYEVSLTIRARLIRGSP